MSSRMRMATDQLAKVWLLDPNGLPVHMSLASNINNGICYELQGRVAMYPKAEEAGWVKMQTKCTAEEWEKWMAFTALSEAKKGRLDFPPMAERPACIRTGPAAAAAPESPPAPLKKKGPKSEWTGPAADEA